MGAQDGGTDCGGGHTFHLVTGFQEISQAKYVAADPPRLGRNPLCDVTGGRHLLPHLIRTLQPCHGVIHETQTKT